MSTSWISELNFGRSLKFEVMSHNNQSGKFFYFICWLSLIFSAQIFFSSTGFKSLESLSFKFQIYFWVDSVRFFLAEFFHFEQWNSFQFRHPISRQPKNLGKKKVNQSRTMEFSCTILRIYKYALSQHFFSSFRSLKKCEETPSIDNVMQLSK